MKDVKIKVAKGAIYGFLGPNGTKKTTTIRLLLGLLPYTHGSIRLFGTGLSENRLNILSRIGTLIEQPSLYEHLTGLQKLKIARIMRKTAPRQISEVLDMVKLFSAANKRVKAYSLGLKYRLVWPSRYFPDLCY